MRKKAITPIPSKQFGIYKGDTVEILVKKKNFSTGQIQYRITGGLLVDSKDVELISNNTDLPKTEEPISNNTDTFKKSIEYVEVSENTVEIPISKNTEQLEDLQNQYKTLSGRACPEKRKTDIEWLESKIDNLEKQKLATTLQALSFPELVELCEKKKLGINTDEVDGKDDLINEIIKIQ